MNYQDKYPMFFHTDKPDINIVLNNYQDFTRKFLSKDEHTYKKWKYEAHSNINTPIYYNLKI